MGAVVFPVGWGCSLPGSIIDKFRVIYIVTCRLERCGRAVGLMVDDKQTYLVVRFESQIRSTA